MKFVSQYGTDTVRLLEFERNRGKGGAVRMVKSLSFHFCLFISFDCSCLSCRGERILFLDADGATEISDTIRQKKMSEIAGDYVIVSIEMASNDIAVGCAHICQHTWRHVQLVCYIQCGLQSQESNSKPNFIAHVTFSASWSSVGGFSP